MDEQNQRILHEQNRITPEELETYNRVVRKRAFWELDAQIEEYDFNDKREVNNGRDFNPDTATIDEIIKNYLARRTEEADYGETRDMRYAVQAVTRLIL